MIWIILNLIFLGLFGKFMVDILLVIWCQKQFGVPYVPSSAKLVGKAIDDLKLKKGSGVVELGSGDGRISLEIARRVEGEVVGYELNDWLIFFSRLWTRLTPVKKGKIRFVKADLFKVNLRKADVVYIYLLPWMIQRLVPKFEKELKKGARVMSFDYLVESGKLRLAVEYGGKKKLRVYTKT